LTNPGLTILIFIIGWIFENGIEEK